MEVFKFVQIVDFSTGMGRGKFEGEGVPASYPLNLRP